MQSTAIFAENMIGVELLYFAFSLTFLWQRSSILHFNAQRQLQQTYIGFDPSIKKASEAEPKSIKTHTPPPPPPPLKVICNMSVQPKATLYGAIDNWKPKSEKLCWLDIIGPAVCKYLQLFVVLCRSFAFWFNFQLWGLGFYQKNMLKPKSCVLCICKRGNMQNPNRWISQIVKEVLKDVLTIRKNICWWLIQSRNHKSIK